MRKKNNGNGGKSKCGKAKRLMDNKNHPHEVCTVKPTIVDDSDDYEASILAYETYYGIPSPIITPPPEIKDDLFPTDTWKPVVQDLPFPIDHCSIMRYSPLSKMGKMTQRNMDMDFDQRRIRTDGGNNFMN